jgi:hypothetical protein
MIDSRDIIMEIIAAIATIIAGFLGASILGLALNWPDAGAVVAIAVMGAFILKKIDRLKK